jgi:hypothetical protein
MKSEQLEKKVDLFCINNPQKLSALNLSALDSQGSAFRDLNADPRGFPLAKDCFINL